MMNDAIKTVKSQLYDRASSPLSGAFIISWCLWNWRMLGVLLSDLNVKEKFAYIDTVLYPTVSEHLFTGFLFPLLTTLFVLYVYPHPARLIYGYWRHQQQLQKKIQQQIDDEEPLTRAEAKEIVSSTYALKNELDLEREHSTAKVKGLEETIKRLNDNAVINQTELAKNRNQISNLESIVKSNKASEPLDPELAAHKLKALKNRFNKDGVDKTEHDDEAKFDLLKNIYKLNGQLSRRDLTSNIESDKAVIIEHNINELTKNKFLSENYDENSDERLLHLTSQGIKALATNSLRI